MKEIKKGSIWYRMGFKGQKPIPFKIVSVGTDIDMKGRNKPFVHMLNCESNQYAIILLETFKKKWVPEDSTRLATPQIAEQRLSIGEAFMYEGQTGRLGGFHTKLYDAITHADNSNLSLLALGFPKEVAICKSWSWDDILDKVEEGYESRYSPFYNREVDG